MALTVSLDVTVLKASHVIVLMETVHVSRDIEENAVTKASIFGVFFFNTSV